MVVSFSPSMLCFLRAPQFRMFSILTTTTSGSRRKSTQKVLWENGASPSEEADSAQENEARTWTTSTLLTSGKIRNSFRIPTETYVAFCSGLIMKRSMAMGRLGLRPGKRSMAYGRQGFRPGKRSMAYGRQGFRPGKRSMAYGRQGFRPGKRSADMMEVIPEHTPEIYIV